LNTSAPTWGVSDRQQPYFEQLLGEAMVTTCSKGQPIREWHPKKGVRHEALDARVYAYAALRALVSMGLVLDMEVERTAGIGGYPDDHRPRAPRISRSQWMTSR
jgi:phage terminase large subunit GpA-like protein